MLVHDLPVFEQNNNIAGVSPTSISNSASASASNAVTNPAQTASNLSVKITLTIVYSLILSTGVIGNICSCFVIADPRNRYMKTATNYYLFSLSISDLLLLTTGVPHDLIAIWYQQPPYLFNTIVCIGRSWLSETSTCASVFVIVAFSVERYIAICHPLKNHTWSRLSRAVKIIVIIWLMASSFAIIVASQFGIVYALDAKTRQLIESTAECTIVHRNEKIFELTTIVFFFVPMTIITLLYMLIGHNLRKSSHSSCSSSNGPPSSMPKSSSHCEQLHQHGQINGQDGSRVVSLRIHSPQHHHSHQDLSEARSLSNLPPPSKEHNHQNHRHNKVFQRRSFVRLSGQLSASLKMPHKFIYGRHQEKPTNTNATSTQCDITISPPELLPLTTQEITHTHTTATTQLEKMSSMSLSQTSFQRLKLKLKFKSSKGSLREDNSGAKHTSLVNCANIANNASNHCDNLGSAINHYPTPPLTTSSEHFAGTIESHLDKEEKKKTKNKNKKNENTNNKNEIFTMEKNDKSIPLMITTNDQLSLYAGDSINYCLDSANGMRTNKEIDVSDTIDNYDKTQPITTITMDNYKTIRRVLSQPLIECDHDDNENHVIIDTILSNAATTTIAGQDKHNKKATSLENVRYKEKLKQQASELMISLRYDNNNRNCDDVTCNNHRDCNRSFLISHVNNCTTNHVSKLASTNLINLSHNDYIMKGKIRQNEDDLSMANNNNSNNNNNNNGLPPAASLKEQTRAILAVNIIPDDLSAMKIVDCLTNQCDPILSHQQSICCVGQKQQQQQLNNGPNNDDDDDYNRQNKLLFLSQYPRNFSHTAHATHDSGSSNNTKITTCSSSQQQQQQQQQQQHQPAKMSNIINGGDQHHDESFANATASSASPKQIIIEGGLTENKQQQSKTSEAASKKSELVITATTNNHSLHKPTTTSDTNTPNDNDHRTDYNSSTTAATTAATTTTTTTTTTTPTKEKHHHPHRHSVSVQLSPCRQTKLNLQPTVVAHRQSVIKMLVAVVVMFFLCWAPFHAQRLMAIYILEPTSTQIVIYELLNHISGISYYISATANPILYSLLSSKFRQAFRDTFGSAWCR